MLASWINGVPGETFSISDRGLAYGDGLFETIAVVDGRPRLLNRHLARLRCGADILGISLPSDPLLLAEIERAAAVAGAAVVKLILTRGAGGRGYRPSAVAQPTRIIMAFPRVELPDGYARDGVALRVCQTRLSEQPALAGLKTLNRLEQVLARREWAEPEPWEGLMLDGAGRVVCGTMTNVFCVRDEVWMTPAIIRAGVAGTVRAGLIEAARQAGRRVEVMDLGLPDLESAQEIFLTNALVGALPVRRLGSITYAPGPAVRFAQDWLRTTR